MGLTNDVRRGRRGAVALAVLVAAGMGCATSGDVDEAVEDAKSDLRAEMDERDREMEDQFTSRMDRMEQQVEAQLQELERSLAELRDEFDVTVERLEGAIRFNAPVHFGFDEATIRSEDQPVLERFAEVVQGYYEGATITVEGFTDPAGPAEYNRRLGQERAEAVKEYLAGAGLPEDRLRAVTYGEDRERQIIPGAQGPGEEGWENRRAAMVIDFTGDQGVTDSPLTEGGEASADRDTGSDDPDAW